MDDPGETTGRVEGVGTGTMYYCEVPTYLLS